MGKLLTAIYRRTYDPFVQGCAHIAKRFQNTTCAHKESPYLPWLSNEGARILVNLQPWGGAMFCCDIVELLNFLFNNNFLTTISRPGGRKATKEEKDEGTGTGQGALPPIVPAPHLADKFSLKEEVLVGNTCNPDTTLAPETPEWRKLGDVTPKYVFCRAMTFWMEKHRQKDKDGVRSYPFETKCLSAGEFLEWKVVPVGLSSDVHGHMLLDNPGLDALFRIWATTGCRLARISWVGAVVTAQDMGDASPSRPQGSCHHVGSTKRKSGGTRRRQAAGWQWAPRSQVVESTGRLRQVPQRQQRRHPQLHHHHSCSLVWSKRSTKCNIVSARSTLRLNRLHPIQPCTVERQLLTH